MSAFVNRKQDFV